MASVELLTLKQRNQTSDFYEKVAHDGALIFTATYVSGGAGPETTRITLKIDDEAIVDSQTITANHGGPYSIFAIKKVTSGQTVFIKGDGDDYGRGNSIAEAYQAVAF